MVRKRGGMSYTPSIPEISTVHPKNDKQQKLLNDIYNKPISIASGSAGSGKSLIALYVGVKLLDQGKIDKIIYVKPNVDFKGERGIGFIKGEIEEKLRPLLAPVIDNLAVFVSPAKAKYMIDKGQIEVGLLEYLRGCSLANTFVLFDEAQNTTPHGILTVISRLRENSKVVITGDPQQCDTGDVQRNGLVDAIRRLKNVSEVGVTEFTDKEILRNDYLWKILSCYKDVY